MLSAVCFGLLHQNFFQFFYALGLGLLMGYLYVRTGKLRYTILLHAIINFMGGVIAPLLAPVAEMAADPQTINARDLLLMMVATLYAFILIGLAIFGLVRLFIRCRQLLFIPCKKAEEVLRVALCPPAPASVKTQEIPAEDKTEQKDSLPITPGGSSRIPAVII